MASIKSDSRQEKSEENLDKKRDYLKKYLGVEKKKKKKKVANKKTAVLQPRFQIIDDDINLPSLSQNDLESEEEYGEEAPQIAAIIDETFMKQSEQRSGPKWKAIDENIQKATERHLDSDGDQSPPRYQMDGQKSPQSINPTLSRDKYIGSKRRNFNDDLSPIRNENITRKRLDSDSDQSPPRTHSSKTNEVLQKNSDSNLSSSHSNNSPHHMKHQRREASLKNKKNITRKRLDSDSDQPSPRSHSSKANKKLSQKNSDSDQSLSRNNSPLHAKHVRRETSLKNQKDQKRLDSDSDQSPPRYSQSRENSNKRPKERRMFNYSDDSQNSSHHKRSSDLSLLQKNHRGSSKDKLHKYSDKTVRKKDIVVVKKEKDFIDKRDSGSNESEIRTKIEKILPKSEAVQNQKEPSNSNLEEGDKLAIEEFFKPFSRYKDDPELEDHLKSQEREGDPMLAYIRNKRAKKPIEISDKPTYKGPQPPPNRFNIRPGYRWDGVDRSNGFEKKYFELQAKKKAQEEIAYKWSVENM